MMQDLEINRVDDNQVKKIRQLLDQENAVLIAHYYTDPAIQYLAEKTGGFIGDSLAMARFGYNHLASTLIIAGVRFMGESAKILSPEKKVLMPTLKAECSLDLSCPIEKFIEFCNQYPDRTKVVYANCSAAVKAYADWVVTSSNAIAIIDFLSSNGEKILWAPDRYLGRYIQQQTDADMILWDGACIVHEEFISIGVEELKKQYPEAGVLVHPESPASVIDCADVVGSTSQLIKASRELAHPVFIVATDRAIFYKMQHAVPEKLLIQAPTAGHGATCQSCGHCPWMAMNTVELLIEVLEQKSQEIILEKSIMDLARISLQRMIKFKEC